MREASGFDVQYEKERKERVRAIASLIWLGGAAVLVLWVTSAFVHPHYRVWQQGMEGKSKLMRAEQERRIRVTEAQAERDAAKLRAEAIAIMGAAAKEFPEYRQQEFVGAFGEALREGRISQVIYVPTEANIPILERKP